MSNRNVLFYIIWGLILLFSFINSWVWGLVLLAVAILSMNKKVGPYLGLPFQIFGGLLLAVFFIMVAVLLFSGQMEAIHLFMVALVVLVPGGFLYWYGKTLRASRQQAAGFNMNSVTNQTFTSTPPQTKTIYHDNGYTTITTSSSSSSSSNSNMNLNKKVRKAIKEGSPEDIEKIFKEIPFFNQALSGKLTDQVFVNAEPKNTTVSCSGCGASNQVNSHEAKCEYCGALLKV